MKKLITFAVCLTLALCLPVNAFAMGFVPSAERKTAPENVGIEGEDGEVHDVIFYDEEGETEVGYLPDDLTIELTDAVDRDEAILDEIRVIIDEAERQITEAGNVGVLAPSMVEELERLKATSTDPAVQALKIEDFVVSNYFDISLVRNGEEIVQVPDGQTVKFRVQTDLRPGDVFYVLVNCDGQGWIPVDSAVVDENGIVTITASQLCVMAFIVPGFRHNVNPGDDTGDDDDDHGGDHGGDKPDDHGGKTPDDHGGKTPGGKEGGSEGGKSEPTSPQTGAADLSWLILVGGVSLAAAVAVIDKKKAKQN